MLVLVVVEAVAIALLALLVAGLLRSHAEIIRSLHELGVDPADPGRPVPHSPSHGHGDELRVAPGVPRPRTTDSVAAADLAGTSPTGDAIAVGVAGAKHDTLLAFLSSFGGGESWDTRTISDGADPARPQVSVENLGAFGLHVFAAAASSPKMIYGAWDGNRWRARLV